MSYMRKTKRLFVRRGILYSLVLSAVIVTFGGLGFWLVEPTIHNFPDGLWLAFVTAATVGYGDTVPTTLWSRAFAIVVVLLGLAVLSLVTASVAAMFVEDEERQIERDLMHEIGRLRADIQELQAEIRLNRTGLLGGPHPSGHNRASVGQLPTADRDSR